MPLNLGVGCGRRPLSKEYRAPSGRGRLSWLAICVSVFRLTLAVITIVQLVYNHVRVVERLSAVDPFPSRDPWR